MIKHFKKFFSLGFFPEELPPEFGPYGITDDVAKDLWNEIDDLRRVDGNPEKKPSEPTTLSFPKSEYVRRNFHFLNPLHFARLSYTILSNWEAIKKHTELSEFSTSRLSFSESDNKIFKNDPFSKSIDERIRRSASKDYVLYVDIENYYPSIYTHTIDWALNEGKKRSHDQYRNRDHLGVALDEDVRKAQHNQTNGIVIGPITSRIISEIITSYLDVELSKKFEEITGTRYVDDYHLFLKTREEVERVQNYLQKLLTTFNLKFNEAKINIEKLPEVYSDNWTSYFDDRYSLVDKGVIKKKELIRRFSKAFELIRGKPENPSLRYFFRVLEDTEELENFNKKILMDLVHHSLKRDPRSISRACLALLKAEVIKEDIHDYLEDFEPTLIKLTDRGHTFEVLWILFLFLQAEREIPDEAINNIVANCDVSCLAYLFLCSNKELVSDDKIQVIKKLITEKTKKVYENIWLSPFWLIAYEDVRQEWKIFKDLEVPASFQSLIDHNIEFLKSESNSNPEDIRISRYERDPDEEEPDLPF